MILDTSGSFLGLDIINNLFVWEVIPNLSIRTGLDFKSLQPSPVFALPWDSIKVCELEIKNQSHIWI